MHPRSRLQWTARRISQFFVTGQHRSISTNLLPHFRRIAMTLHNAVLKVFVINSSARQGSNLANPHETSFKRAIIAVLAIGLILLVGSLPSSAQLSTATTFG